MWIKIWLNWWIRVCNSRLSQIAGGYPLKICSTPVQNHGEHIGKELARYSEDPHSNDKTCAKVTHEITPYQLGLLPLYM